METFLSGNFPFICLKLVDPRADLKIENTHSRSLGLGVGSTITMLTLTLNLLESGGDSIWTGLGFN